MHLTILSNNSIIFPSDIVNNLFTTESYLLHNHFVFTREFEYYHFLVL